MSNVSSIRRQMQQSRWKSSPMARKWRSSNRERCRDIEWRRLRRFKRIPHPSRTTSWSQTLGQTTVFRALVSAADFSPGAFKVALVDINGTIIPYDRNGQGTKGYRISATITGASLLSITEDTSSSLTSSGETSLVPVLTAVPTAGEYNITFSAADCSSGTCATSLSILDHAQFSVQPGQLAGLTASPGGVTESSISNDALFPSDGIILRGGLNISIGSFTIDIVDIAGNALQSLSENEVTVNASIVTSTRDANGVYAERSVGADLAGTLMKVTSDGRVSFDDLYLVARAPSGSRAIGSNDDITYDAATRGTLASFQNTSYSLEPS